MGLLVYKCSDYVHTAEREQYRTLCKQLKGYYDNREEICLLLANYNIGDCELDALFIKQDAIIIVEFKNYGGHIIASNNGDWTADKTVIQGGGPRKTVYQQARVNHAEVKRALVDDKLLSAKDVKHIAVLIVFNQAISMTNNLNSKTRSWLHVCDNSTFIEKVQDITSETTVLNREDILQLIPTMNLQRDYFDKDYSDMRLLAVHNQPTVLPQTTVATPPAGASSPDKIALPSWLDDYIYKELAATYSPQRQDITTIEWNKAQVLQYLGTYFPRSYMEAYCLFSRFLLKHRTEWNTKTNIYVFDFGCGTGGQLIGMLTAIDEVLSGIVSITISALDGNKHSLRICERIVSEFQQHSQTRIDLKPLLLPIDDLYDLNLMETVVTSGYDIVLSFKAVCEFISKSRFNDKNAYGQFVQAFAPKMSKSGVMVIADVTTYNEQAKEWLPTIMDEGLSALSVRYNIERNQGFYETFTISHSRHSNDISKIAWRIITSK